MKLRSPLKYLPSAPLVSIECYTAQLWSKDRLSSTFHRHCSSPLNAAPLSYKAKISSQVRSIAVALLHWMLHHSAMKQSSPLKFVAPVLLTFHLLCPCPILWRLITSSYEEKNAFKYVPSGQRLFFECCSTRLWRKDRLLCTFYPNFSCFVNKMLLQWYARWRRLLWTPGNKEPW